VSLQLIDAPTGAVLVDDIQAGSIINLATLSGVSTSPPELNLVAVDTTGAIAAVKFLANGRTEGAAPYSYCGDTNGGEHFYTCSDLSTTGVHTIAMKLFGSGNVLLGQPSISFTLVSISLQLIDAATGKTVRDNLQQAASVSLEELGLGDNPGFNIIATDEMGDVHHVKFSNDHTEGSVPFSYCGDTAAGSSFNTCNDLVMGTHTISIKLFDASNTKKAEPSFPLELFGPETIDSLKLIYAPTGAVVADPIHEGAILDMTALGPFTEPSFIIRATPSVASVKSAKFAHCKTDTLHSFEHCSDDLISGEELSMPVQLYNGEQLISSTVIGSLYGDYRGNKIVRFTTVNGATHEER